MNLEIAGIGPAFCEFVEAAGSGGGYCGDTPFGQSLGRVNLKRDPLTGERDLLFEREPIGFGA